MADTPHSPPGRPVVGNALDLGADPLRFLTAAQTAYGGRHPLVRVDAPDVGPTATVVTDPGVVHEVLGDRERFRRPDAGPEAFDRDGLVASEGELWETQRSILEPQFVGSRLAGYADTAGDAVEATLAGWPEAGELDLLRETAALAMQVISRTLFSVDTPRATSDAIHEASRAFGRELEFSPIAALLPQELQSGPDDEVYEAIETVESYAREVVDWHRAQAEPPADLVTALLEAQADGADLADDELLDQTFLFITGGHETTALTITYAFYWLSQRPAVRERVRAEARAVLDGDRPGWSDLPDLRVTERVVRETLRLTPAAWNLTREPRRPTRVAGHRVEAGELLLMSPYAHHRDPRAFHEPEAFRPERWDADGGATRANPSYFPFGSGPRSCIGRQLALTEAQFTLAHVLQSYDVEVLADRLEFRPGATLQPEGTVEARVEAL